MLLNEDKSHLLASFSEGLSVVRKRRVSNLRNLGH